MGALVIEGSFVAILEVGVIVWGIWFPRNTRALRPFHREAFRDSVRSKDRKYATWRDVRHQFLRHILESTANVFRGRDMINVGKYHNGISLH